MKKLDFCILGIVSLCLSHPAAAMIVIDDPDLGTGNSSSATINGAIFTVDPISGGTETDWGCPIGC